MSYTELTVWTRGIIMDKEGRDIVNSIAASARLEGKYAQAMENYVDNPDRTNAPTRKYCRVSDNVIENELTYENEQPNIIVLVEGTMVKGWDYMRGMPRRNSGDQHALLSGIHDSFRPGPGAARSTRLCRRRQTGRPQVALLPAGRTRPRSPFNRRRRRAQ